jgi:hypothetical protein
MCIGVDHKKFGKKNPDPWCASGAFVLVGLVSSYIGGYLLKYVVKYIVILCYL